MHVPNLLKSRRPLLCDVRRSSTDVPTFFFDPQHCDFGLFHTVTPKGHNSTRKSPKWKGGPGEGSPGAPRNENHAKQRGGWLSGGRPVVDWWSGWSWWLCFFVPFVLFFVLLAFVFVTVLFLLSRGISSRPPSAPRASASPVGSPPFRAVVA